MSIQTAVDLCWCGHKPDAHFMHDGLVGNYYWDQIRCHGCLAEPALSYIAHHKPMQANNDN